MKKISLITTLLFLSIFTLALSNDPNPVGEKAHYQVIHGNRTSSMIKKGTFDIEVLRGSPILEEALTYITSLKYNLQISFVGRKKGEKLIGTPNFFFSSNFIKRLRQEETIQTPSFTISHLGYVNTTTEDGTIYENCDKIKIYNIETEEALPFIQFIKNMTIKGLKTKDGVSTEDIENLEIIALRTENLPVLSAIQIDIKGDIMGFPFKAGLDYVESP